MILTGKCKEDFAKWYDNYVPRNAKFWMNVKAFWDAHPSMKWGVLIDFFESEEIRINIYSEIDFIGVSVNDFHLGNHFKYLKDARNEAVQKANEIYNNLKL